MSIKFSDIEDYGDYESVPLPELIMFYEELAERGRSGQISRSNNPGDSAGVPQKQQDMIYNKEERSKS